MSPWEMDDADIGFGIEIPSGGGIDLGNVFSSAGQIFGAVTGAAASIWKTRNEFSLQRENNVIRQQQNSFANQLALTQAAGAVDIQKSRINAEVAKNNLQAQLASFVPSAGGGGISVVHIAIVAAIGFVLYKFAK